MKINKIILFTIILFTLISCKSLFRNSNIIENYANLKSMRKGSSRMKAFFSAVVGEEPEEGSAKWNECALNEYDEPSPYWEIDKSLGGEFGLCYPKCLPNLNDVINDENINTTNGYNDGYSGRGPVCWAGNGTSYGRGAGIPINTDWPSDYLITIPHCPISHPEYDKGLCYKSCSEIVSNHPIAEDKRDQYSSGTNYYPEGPLCWQKCSSNEIDIGALCRKKSWDVVGSNAGKFFTGIVGGENMEDDETVMKHTVGRGVGIIPSCVITDDDIDGKCNEEVMAKIKEEWSASAAS